MVTGYTYTKQIVPEVLMDEVNNAVGFFPTNISYNKINFDFEVVFDNPLDATGKTALDTVVSQHLYVNPDLTSGLPQSFDVDQVNFNLSYIGYGVPNACKIQRIITFTDATYEALWADGTQDLNKIWDNRTGYTYS